MDNRKYSEEYLLPYLGGDVNKENKAHIRGVRRVHSRVSSGIEYCVEIVCEGEQPQSIAKKIKTIEEARGCLNGFIFRFLI